LVLLIVTAGYLTSIVLHESMHWGISILEPWIEPIEFHALDGYAFNHGVLGRVIYTEAYPNAFQDRPWFMTILQELICYSIQIVFLILIVKQVAYKIDIIGISKKEKKALAIRG